MATRPAPSMTAEEIAALETSAVSLLTSLKGILDARVEVDARGRIFRMEVVPQGIDDRAAARNAQSAVMAVIGQNVDVNAIVVVGEIDDDSAGAGVVGAGAGASVSGEGASAGAGVSAAGVLELKIPPVKNGELNVAARVAFDTLRMAQSSFHGFQFDGAELVRITGQQYVVVAVKSLAGGTKYCGAAAVTDSVSTASARALMNAVGTAAMGSSAMDIGFEAPGYGVLEA
jgi:hypothetical protein